MFRIACSTNSVAHGVTSSLVSSWAISIFEDLYLSIPITQSSVHASLDMSYFLYSLTLIPEVAHNYGEGLKNNDIIYKKKTKLLKPE